MQQNKSKGRGRSINKDTDLHAKNNPAEPAEKIPVIPLIKSNEKIPVIPLKKPNEKIPVIPLKKPNEKIPVIPLKKPNVSNKKRSPPNHIVDSIELAEVDYHAEGWALESKQPKKNY